MGVIFFTTTTVLVLVATTLTTAAIWYRFRPQVVVARCRRIVEKAEASGKEAPELAQQEFRFAINKLRKVERSLTEQCRSRSGGDRILCYLTRPGMARLWRATEDTLGRAELDIGLSLLSQERSVRKATVAIPVTGTRHFSWSLAVAQESRQLTSNLRDEAIRHLEAAVAVAPYRDEYLYALAQAYEVAERNEECLAAIRAAINMNPAAANYYHVLTDVAWKTRAYQLYNRGLLGIVESSGRFGRARN